MNNINEYKEITVADVIDNMRDYERIMITDMRTLNYIFFGHISDLKSYSGDENIQAILKLNVLRIDAGVNFAYRYYNLYINTPDDGKFDVDYLIKRLENMETDTPFFDQMISKNAVRVSGQGNNSLKNIAEEFKKLAKLNVDDIDIDINNNREPVCPFHPIWENPGESYLSLDERDTLPFSTPFIDRIINANSDNNEIKITVIKKREEGK